MERLKNNLKIGIRKVPYVNYIFDKYYARETTCMVVSYPKSGRTWLRVMIAQVLAAQSGKADIDSVEPNRVIKDNNISGVWFGFTHDGEGNNAEKVEAYETLNTAPLYSNKSVIFLVRDPRDVLVSRYFHQVNREKNFEGSISEFIRHPLWGTTRLLDFYARWSTYQSQFDRFHLVRYEDLHADTVGELENIFSFIDYPVPPSAISQAVEFAQIENLRKLSANNLTKVHRLAPADKDNPESYKIRKGKVGGYVDYLNDDDIAYINLEMTRRAETIFGYEATNG